MALLVMLDATAIFREIRCYCRMFDQFKRRTLMASCNRGNPTTIRLLIQACSQTSRLKSNLRVSTGPAIRGGGGWSGASGLGEADAAAAAKREAAGGRWHQKSKRRC